MRVGLFGIPWYVYALVCLLVAVGYAVFTIEPVKGFNWRTQPGWRFVILRWFHGLVWLLLCLACLLMQYKGEPATYWAKAISLLSLLLYLVYMVTFFSEKSRSTA